MIKRFKDGMGTPVDLEAKFIGVYKDDKQKEYDVYKPVSSAWWGMYHLVPKNGGRPKYIIDPSKSYAKAEDTFEGKLIKPE